MPARTVVIEKLTKFTGDHHEQLTPGQYTQLTGRAGRRGIDELGHAVVLVEPVRALRSRSPSSPAAGRSICARRSGRRTTWPPTWCARTETRRRTTCSTCRSRSSRPIATSCASRPGSNVNGRGWSDCGEEAQSPYGDIDEYRQAIEQAREPRGRDDPVELAMLKLRPGNVVYVNKGKYRGPAAVVASAHRKGGLRLTTITAGGDSIQLTAADFGMPPRQLATVTLPTPYAPNRHDYRREVGRRVKSAKLASRGQRRRASVEGGAAGVRHTFGDAPRRSRSRPPGKDQGRRTGRPCRARDRRAREPRAAPQPVTGEGVRRCARRAVDVRLRRPRGVGPHRGGSDAGADVPRIGSAGHPVSAAGAARRPHPRRAGRAGVDVRLRASRARRPAPTRGSRPMASSAGGAASPRSARTSPQSSAATDSPSTAHPIRRSSPSPMRGSRATASREVVADEELTGGDFVRTMKQLIDLLEPDRDRRPRSRHTARRPAGRRRLRSATSSPIPRPHRRWSDDEDHDRDDHGVTIRKGVDWGERVARPEGLIVVGSDAELAVLVASGSRAPMAVAAGDLHRTLGDGGRR